MKYNKYLPIVLGTLATIVGLFMLGNGTPKELCGACLMVIGTFGIFYKQ